MIKRQSRHPLLPAICMVFFLSHASAPALQAPSAANHALSIPRTQSQQHRAPVLGADMTYADYPWTLIEGWKNKSKADAMDEAFRRAGIRSLRFSSHGLYSSVGAEATRALKAENKVTNQYTWFPLDDFVEYIATHN